jgi:hypothetical protein
LSASSPFDTCREGALVSKGEEEEEEGGTQALASILCTAPAARC